MADYAEVIVYFRAKYKATSVIVFGGSYGGMLASWMRQTYPALVSGAIASTPKEENKDFFCFFLLF
jgi:lysosomal Pro-X carboxypeptidase